LPSLRTDTRHFDDDIRTCAKVVFEHFGSASRLYALKKVKEAQNEGNMEAVVVWIRIAAVAATFSGMEHSSTAIH
jgi:hypothetical protein